VIAYPPELPITARRAEIVEAIRRHQVVIISGETGCGKSTQIPKMCLEAGRGRRGRIGCTQPRRIAAVTIAARIAEERGEPLGRSVGYKIRFDDRTSCDTRIKVLTDGMLLAETQSDPRLLEYDTLIIDEAHERSLNIDFLLGIVKTLLPVRPELKLIVTSATLDIEKFRRAFAAAPLLEVSGRMYPVEVEYRPPDAGEDGGDAEDADYVDLAADVVDELKRDRPEGDILVFMPTEQDILETCEILEGRKYAGVSILPLYARLPGSQQGRVYSVKGPKIVVATNVAETSLTIPGIKYVVDTGLARISQYLPGARIQSLPIRPISKSSADQRKGRCGRVQKGVCVRLYSEEDYEARLPFTSPEILRSNLAEVILRMIDLRLGHPLTFPFVDRPNPKNVEDGFETLVELGAIRREGGEPRLTERGRIMARMPLDPRVSRILLEAREEGCLREAAVIASALSIRDPRERPLEKAAQADAMHAPFRDPDSDFLTLLNIWDRYHGDFEELKGLNRKRKFCHEHFLSFPRMREWTFVHAEVLDILRELKIPAGRTAPAGRTKESYAALHRSIAAGYLSNIAVRKERNTYTAAKGREVTVFPGSTLSGKNASWIVAVEMVRTSRLFARVAARIEGDWLEELGGALCRYSYANPRWDKGKGQVVADESAALFGLEIVSGRAVPYGRIDPAAAQRIFIRSALVGGEVRESFDFLGHNLALRARMRTAEEKLRRRDLLADDKVLYEFYASRLDGVIDIRGLKERLKSRGGDEFLRMTEADVLRVFPDPAELALFPDTLSAGSARYPAVYRFAPGEDDDGVTLHVPMDEVGRLSVETLAWGVPGQLKERITELVKGLPKRYRKLFVPVSDSAEVILKDVRPSDGPLFGALSTVAKRRFRADIPADEWAAVELPRHLRMRIALVDPHGKEIVVERDLEALRRARREAVRTAAQDPGLWERARRQWERTEVPAWEFGPVPEIVSIGPAAVAYPGLASGPGLTLRLFQTPEEACASHEAAIESILLQKYAKDVKYMERHIVLPAEARAPALFFGGAAAIEKAMQVLLRTEILRRGIRSGVELKSYAETVVRLLFEKGTALVRAAEAVIEAHRKARAAIDGVSRSNPASPTLAALAGGLKSELEALAPKDVFEKSCLDELARLPRYLEALAVRAGRVRNDPEKDRKKAGLIEPWTKAREAMAKRWPARPSEGLTAARDEFRRLVEEFKVAVFAPELKPSVPVSSQRLSRQQREIEAMLAEESPPPKPAARKI
jgi:ATP-dependent helicase HrpA